MRQFEPPKLKSYFFFRELVRRIALRGNFLLNLIFFIALDKCSYYSINFSYSFVSNMKLSPTTKVTSTKVQSDMKKGFSILFFAHTSLHQQVQSTTDACKIRQ
jgi:hypothetical protein